MKDKIHSVVKMNSSCDLLMKQMKISIYRQVDISLEYTPKIMNELFRKKIP